MKQYIMSTHERYANFRNPVEWSRPFTKVMHTIQLPLLKQVIIIIIKTLFQEATHLTTRQSSMSASNNRKQLTNKLTNICVHINWTD